MRHPLTERLCPAEQRSMHLLPRNQADKRAAEEVRIHQYAIMGCCSLTSCARCKKGTRDFNS